MQSHIFNIFVLCVVAYSAYATELASQKTSDDRSFISSSYLTTFTLIKYSTTSTSTFTSTTYCTTSTATLKTCTKSGGRKRRGLSVGTAGSRHRRGLFFDDDEAANDGSIFLPSEKRSTDPVDEVKPVAGRFSETIVPLELQSGFALPDGVDDGRFLLAVGTTTIVSYSVTTKTSTLTAICQSTTGWSLCGSSGK